MGKEVQSVAPVLQDHVGDEDVAADILHEGAVPDAEPLHVAPASIAPLELDALRVDAGRGGLWLRLAGAPAGGIRIAARKLERLVEIRDETLPPRAHLGGVHHHVAVFIEGEERARRDGVEVEGDAELLPVKLGPQMADAEGVRARRSRTEERENDESEAGLRPRREVPRAHVSLAADGADAACSPSYLGRGLLATRLQIQFSRD